MGPGLQVLLEPGGRIVNNTSQAPSQKWQQRALLANLLTILLRLCRLPLLQLNAQYITALLPNGIKSNIHMYHTCYQVYNHSIFMYGLYVCMNKKATNLRSVSLRVLNTEWNYTHFL